MISGARTAFGHGVCGTESGGFLGATLMAEPATARNAVNGLLDKAAIYPKQLALIDWLAGKYLDDPNSPMRNEDIYIMFPSGGDARVLGIGSEKAALFFCSFNFTNKK